LASASDDYTLRLWGPTTGEELRLLRGHTKGVDYVAISPDGKQVASSGGSLSAETKVWDVARSY
jgi:WD40 repeat protein